MRNRVASGFGQGQPDVETVGVGVELQSLQVFARKGLTCPVFLEHGRLK